MSRCRRRPGAPFQRIRSSRGLTLIEVMVAALVITVVAIGSVAFFARGRVLIDQEERKRVATLLAQESLEASLGQAAAMADTTFARTIAGIEYRVALDVQNDTPETGVHTVQAKVSWPAGTDGTRDATLTTIVYPRLFP